MKPRFWGRTGISVFLCIGAAGCHRKPAAPLTMTPTRKTPANGASSKPTALTPTELAMKPNEAGLVPILMYHSIEASPKADKVNSWIRSPKGFRQELERMYKQGYRPVNLSEYLDNKIGLEIGKSPVVLTFDDARETQFRYLADGKIDPDCAVGILEEFSKSHPDWPVKATFFVQPTSGTRTGFGQADSLQKKLQALVAMGCEIQNHTMTHPFLKRLSDENVQKEIALCQQEIQKLIPNAKVDALALPFGVWPRNKKLAADGQYNGIKYHNRAVLLVGSNPAPSVIAKRFNPLKIPRIQAADGTYASSMWLEQIKNSHSCYISDGDPNVTTVPSELVGKIDKKRLNGAALRTY